MWTPALQRERRIALQDRSTRFFGTDFSFEDLEERDVNQFDYRLLGEEPIDGASVLADRIRADGEENLAVHAGRRSGSGRTTMPFAQVESFIKSDARPALEIQRLRADAGNLDRAPLEMNDLRRNSRTILTLEKLQYNVPMKEEDFTLAGAAEPTLDAGNVALRGCVGDCEWVAFASLVVRRCLMQVGRPARRSSPIAGLRSFARSSYPQATPHDDDRACRSKAASASSPPTCRAVADALRLA